jgi:hypothetical protein
MAIWQYLLSAALVVLGVNVLLFVVLVLRGWAPPDDWYDG